MADSTRIVIPGEYPGLSRRTFGKALALSTVGIPLLAGCTPRQGGGNRFIRAFDDSPVIVKGGSLIFGFDSDFSVETKQGSHTATIINTAWDRKRLEVVVREMDFLTHIQDTQDNDVQQVVLYLTREAGGKAATLVLTKAAGGGIQITSDDTNINFFLEKRPNSGGRHPHRWATDLQGEGRKFLLTKVSVDGTEYARYDNALAFAFS